MFINMYTNKSVFICKQKVFFFNFIDKIHNSYHIYIFVTENY